MYRVDLRNGKSGLVDSERFEMSPLIVRFFKDGITVAAYASDMLESIVQIPEAEKTPAPLYEADDVQCYFTKWEKRDPSDVKMFYVPANDCVLPSFHKGDHMTSDGRHYSRLTGNLSENVD